MKKSSKSLHFSSKPVSRKTSTDVLSKPFEIFLKSSVFEQHNQKRIEEQRKDNAIIIRTLPFIKRISNYNEVDLQREYATPMRKTIKTKSNDHFTAEKNYHQSQQSSQFSEQQMTKSQVRFYVQNVGSNLNSLTTSKFFSSTNEVLPSKKPFQKQIPISVPTSPSYTITQTPFGTTSSAFKSTASNFATFYSKSKSRNLNTDDDNTSPTKLKQRGDIAGRIEVQKLAKTMQESNTIEDDILFDTNNQNNDEQLPSQFNETQKQFFENFMQETKPVFSNDVIVLSETEIQQDYPFQIQGDIQSLENPNSSLAFLNGFPHNFPFIENTLRAAEKARDEIVRIKEGLKDEMAQMKKQFNIDIEQCQQESKQAQIQVLIKIKSDFVKQQTFSFALNKEIVRLLKEKNRMEAEVEQGLNKIKSLEENLYGQEIFNLQPQMQSFKNITSQNLRLDAFQRTFNQSQMSQTVAAKSVQP